MYGQAGVEELYLKLRGWLGGAIELIVQVNGWKEGLCSFLEACKRVRLRVEENLNIEHRC
jgi:hypothetical protein